MSNDPVLIYDGECGFCRQSLSWGQRKLKAFPASLPSQDARAKILGLSEGELAAQVWLVGGKLRSGKALRLGGARAIAYIFRMQPSLGWRILGWLMLVGLPISNIVYLIVAKNRGKLGSKNCEV